MAIINKNTGRFWQMSSFCPWINIIRPEDSTTTSLSPFDQHRNTVTIQPSPDLPEVELEQEVAAPLADIQSAIKVMNAGWEQLVSAQSDSAKRFAVQGLRHQLEAIKTALNEYEAKI